MISFIVGALVGALVMDYMWARKTGVDRQVYHQVRDWFASWTRK